MKTNKISIAGDLGSGKSIVCAALQKELDYEVISTGAIQRRIAERLNMTTLELNEYSESHPEIDDEIDAHLKALKNESKPYIIDSRLAWFFVPNSFKVYLQVDVDIAVERIFKDTSRKSEHYESKESAKQQIIERKASENRRYLALYGADCGNKDLYDVVVDTSVSTPDAVTEAIVQHFNLYNDGTAFERFVEMSRK